ncbi:hypothetical protein JKP23_10060 [Vibrio vulnificus]|uniref:hypothetical protein n=1 Tax=Vibrio vulnificus TaxID=672 RepID=UPI001CDCCB43|nr:hypothetical protein [Vibrio vulnificus]ELP6986230.1 hypothetical protein [Vibrio vulnificus]MCA3897444.1 hypothetical protein [Vibrio vulnificus]
MRYLTLFVIPLIFSAFSHALTVNISIKGDKVTYDNAVITTNSNYKPTSSEIISGITPTKKWIPTASSIAKKLAFSSSSDEAEVEVEIWGMEYDVGSLDTTLVRNDENGLEKSQCSLQRRGTSYQIMESFSDNSCIATMSVNNAKENIPFFFVRPLFKFNNLTESLKGKAEGVYVSSIEVPFRYYFYNSMSILTYRNLSFHLTFQINYIPETFSSLVVTSENGGVITPKYGSGTVKGETRFNIDTFGYFNVGIKMKFDTSKKYNLDHESKTEKKVPYYIHCDICEDRVIVDDSGKITTSVLNNSGVVLVPVGSDKTKINFNLTVGYSDKTVNDVVTGEYSDSFAVIFGLDF